MEIRMPSSTDHPLPHQANALKVACPCGAVHLHISGEPLAQFYCHCDDCQAAHSAAYVAESVYPASTVLVAQGAPRPHVVRTTPRLSCTSCGTRLFAEIAAGDGLRGVNAYLLPPGAFQPQFHIHCQHAVLPVMDDLPHYRGFPAAFGGTDERVEW